MHWVNWESTDEYDTDVDTAAQELHKRLQARLQQIQSLEAGQLPEAVVAEIVMQVVESVTVMMPVPEDMDTSGAGPGASMGPGMPVQSKDMPVVLNVDE